VLLIYTVKSSKSRGSDKERKHLRKKLKIHCHYPSFSTIQYNHTSSVLGAVPYLFFKSRQLALRNDYSLYVFDLT
jgi:hypothetical protein